MKVRQEFVEQRVYNQVVEIQGKYFRSKEFVENGTEIMFVVFYDDKGVKPPIFAYRPGDSEQKFSKWWENKPKRCSLGAEET